MTAAETSGKTGSRLARWWMFPGVMPYPDGGGIGRARLGGGRNWALARVATVIARRFHVGFSPAQNWRVLHPMGFTAQVRLRRAAERDEGAVAT
ncbi:winged helix-turn-helix domain-containing protein [Streptomyces sp. NPDC002589]|uniref:helix-turn-helix domain-containing protein n=1 Tax=Streptomyces sp. NPDC002589 TaxID=3154420 RepID=UPI00332AA35E